MHGESEGWKVKVEVWGWSRKPSAQAAGDGSCLEPDSKRGGRGGEDGTDALSSSDGQVK